MSIKIVYATHEDDSWADHKEYRFKRNIFRNSDILRNTHEFQLSRGRSEVL